MVLLWPCDEVSRRTDAGVKYFGHFVFQIFIGTGCVHLGRSRKARIGSKGLRRSRDGHVHLALESLNSLRGQADVAVNDLLAFCVHR